MVDLRIETRNLGVAKWRPLDLDGCVSDSTSPAEALLRLQQYRHDGARTPHKPLLVLLALSQLADRGTSELQWDTVGGRLGELLVEFGPAATTPALQRAAYPFTRLRSDGVWELSDDVPMDTLSGLRAGGISGHLTSAIERELLADPARIPVYSSLWALILNFRQRQRPSSVRWDESGAQPGELESWRDGIDLVPSAGSMAPLPEHRSVSRRRMCAGSISMGPTSSITG